LGGMVVREVADDYICVEAYHRPFDQPDLEARFAIAAFISSIDTGLLRFP